MLGCFVTLVGVLEVKHGLYKLNGHSILSLNFVVFSEYPIIRRLIEIIVSLLFLKKKVDRSFSVY